MNSNENDRSDWETTWSFSICFFRLFFLFSLNWTWPNLAVGSLLLLLFNKLRYVMLGTVGHRFKRRQKWAQKLNAGTYAVVDLDTVLKRCPMTRRHSILNIIFCVFFFLLRCTTFGECECTIQYQFYVSAKWPLALHPDYLPSHWNDVIVERRHHFPLWIMHVSNWGSSPSGRKIHLAKTNK